MAIQNGFFKSINGDRRYLAEFFTSYFASFIGNGVFPNPSTNLQVISNQNFSTVVRPGKGWINGHYLNNDDNVVINHQPPDGVLRRIDRIVFSVNLDSRSMDIYLKQGTPSGSAVAPALIRNSTLYELALADISFNPGMVSISQSNITDQRMNKALCGIVHGVVEQLDTTTLFNQYQQFLVEKGVEFDQQLAVNQETFDTWFAQLNDILDGDVAANLANMIITHTNNATPQKHIEVVNSIPASLANKGLLLVVDDVDNPNNPPEIPTSAVLNSRIDFNYQQINLVDNKKADKTETNNLSINKADRTYVDGLISGISSASPRDVFYSIQALESAFPDGEIGTYLVFDTSFPEGAHAFIFSGEERVWKDVGLYQANGLADNSVTPMKTDFLEEVNSQRINYFNKNTVITGGYYNNLGTYIASSTVSSSDFFEVKKNDVIRVKSQTQGNTHITYWDANDVFVSGELKVLFVDQVAAFNVPNNDNIVKSKIAVRNNELNVYMITINLPYPDSYVSYDDVSYDIAFRPRMEKALDDYIIKNSNLQGLKWGIIGDSISTVGYKGGEYPEKIANRHNMITQNLAVPGSLIAKSNKSGHANTHMSQRVLLLDLDCNIVTIAGGTNDERFNLPIGTFNDTSIETFYGAMHELCKNLINRFPATAKGIFTPPKMRGRNVNLKRYVDVIKEVAAYYSVPVFDIFNEGDLQPDINLINNNYFDNADGIHPNSLGHDIQVPKRENFMKSLLLNNY